MSSIDPVSGVDSTELAKTYTSSAHGGHHVKETPPTDDQTLAGMADSMHMSGEDLHKFMQNLLNSITSSIKSDTDHAVQALKDATKNLEQASAS